MMEGYMQIGKIIDEIERQIRNYEELTGKDFMLSCGCVYMEENVRKKIEAYNNGMLVEDIPDYKTIMGITIVNEPQEGCIIIRNSLLDKNNV